MPELRTLVNLAIAVKIHPMHLLQKVLDCVPMCYRVKPRYVAGDRSAFVQDVTIPDNTVVSPGQVFTKVWESQNVGNVPWLGRRLRCVDE